MNNEIRNQLVEYYNVGKMPTYIALINLLCKVDDGAKFPPQESSDVMPSLFKWDHQEAWGTVEKLNTWVNHQGLLGLAEYNKNKKQMVPEHDIKTTGEIKSYYDDLPVSSNNFRHMIESMHDVGVAQTFHVAIGAMDKTEQKHLLNLITTMGDQEGVANPTELMFLGKRIVDLLTLLEKFFANQDTPVLFDEDADFKTEE